MVKIYFSAIFQVSGLIIGHVLTVVALFINGNVFCGFTY